MRFALSHPKQLLQSVCISLRVGKRKDYEDYTSEKLLRYHHISPKNICFNLGFVVYRQPRYVIRKQIGQKMNFSGKIVIMTGASRGIGAASAKDLPKREQLSY